MEPTCLCKIIDVDEMRVVSLERDEEALAVVERTDGELTYQAFGELTHVRVARIPTRCSAQLCAALGYADSAERALRSFFASQRFLSDLLDLLDAAGIPYDIAIVTPQTTYLRPSASLVGA